jgi:hypothetical protein
MSEKKIIDDLELTNVTGGEQQRDPGENFYSNARSTPAVGGIAIGKNAPSLNVAETKVNAIN